MLRCLEVKKSSDAQTHFETHKKDCYKLMDERCIYNKATIAQQVLWNVNSTI